VRLADPLSAAILIDLLETRRMLAIGNAALTKASW